ncbi:hypothetical protein BCR44DRAFT_1442055, partial [Catenaria anguillulae PL171]
IICTPTFPSPIVSIVSTTRQQTPEPVSPHERRSQGSVRRCNGAFRPANRGTLASGRTGAAFLNSALM